MVTCIVQLDNLQGEYYPGNTVLGKAICSFSKPINTRGIRVTLEGKEHTQWSQQVSYYDKDLLKTVVQSVPVLGSNNILDIVSTVAGEGSYPAGRHEFPFTFILPRSIPSTYQGKYGWIKYSIKYTVVIPFGFDHQDILEFRVMAPIDFNEIPRLQLTPVTTTGEKNVRWLFRSCGVITMDLHLEKAVFVLGEVVKVQVEVLNMSTENVERIEIKMGSTIESIAVFPSREKKNDYEEMAVASDTGVGAHGERTYLFDLVVPESTVVPNFTSCKLFQQSAKIEVKAILKGLHTNMTVSVPIKLGNIPVRSTEQIRNPQDFHPTSSYGLPQAPPYLTGGASCPPYSACAPQSPIASRELPPPYSEVDTNQQSGMFPQTPSSRIYPSLSASDVPPKTAHEDSIKPSAPPSEESKVDGDFVLL